MRQFAVIGLGRFGSSVAKTLSEKDCQVLAIDINGDKVQDASAYVTQAVQVDATDEKALRAVGIENVDCAIIGIGKLDASILIALTLKEIGISEIVTKAVNPTHGKVLRRIGATKVAFPERDMGARLANTLISPKILEQIELSPDYSIMETVAPNKFLNKSLEELDMRAKFGVNVIAIRKKEPTITEAGETEVKERINIAPEAGDVIEEGDVLVVIGSKEDVEKLRKLE